MDNNTLLRFEYSIQYLVLCNHRCLIRPFSFGDVYGCLCTDCPVDESNQKYTDNHFWLHLFIEQHAYRTLRGLFCLSKICKFPVVQNPLIVVHTAHRSLIHCTISVYPKWRWKKGRQNNFVKRFIAVVLINFSAWDATHFTLIPISDFF